MTVSTLSPLRSARFFALTVVLFGTLAGAGLSTAQADPHGPEHHGGGGGAHFENRGGGNPGAGPRFENRGGGFPGGGPRGEHHEGNFGGGVPRYEHREGNYGNGYGGRGNVGIGIGIGIGIGGGYRPGYIAPIAPRILAPVYQPPVVVPYNPGNVALAARISTAAGTLVAASSNALAQAQAFQDFPVSAPLSSLQFTAGALARDAGAAASGYNPGGAILADYEQVQAAYFALSPSAIDRTQIPGPVYAALAAVDQAFENLRYTVGQ